MTPSPDELRIALLHKHIAQGRARCRGCGYSLRGLVELRCPECGHAIALEDFRWQGELKRAFPGLALLLVATLAWGAGTFVVIFGRPLGAIAVFAAGSHLLLFLVVIMFAWIPPRRRIEMEWVRWGGITVAGLSMLLLGFAWLRELLR